MANEQVLQMFKAECQMLASLNHCNIAKVFDSGETEDGRPYFVLEFVDGSHITDYCDGHEMTIANRIKLLIKVCRTIHEAHLKGVIHRDLKPSNILVIKESGDSLPKVIDFGIAKAMGTQGSPGSRAAKSATGPIGTLNYMSPEQAGFDDVDVDRLTDVYSLGIVAYELLVGYLPLSGEEVTLSSLLASFGTGQRLSPSAKWNTLGERKMLNVAHRRNCTPSSLGVAIDELDAIVMKCLEVNRSKRYETADSLANDLQDYLRSRERLPRPFLYGIAGIVVYGIAGIVVLAAIVWSFVRHPLGQTDSVSPHQTEALPIDAPQPLVNSDLDTAHNVINRAIGNLDNR